MKQLLLEAIRKLTEKGANVHVLVFDGAPKNLGMAEKLGCDIKKLDGSFDHPSKPNVKTHVILDICHMLKLARNAFSHMGIFALHLERESHGNTYTHFIVHNNKIFSI